jgi:hypothetical protein
VKSQLQTRVQRGASLFGLPLGGCQPETAEYVAISVVLATLLLVTLLVVAPSIVNWRSRREHHKRMYERRPWSPEDRDANGRAVPQPKSRRRRRRSS